MTYINLYGLTKDIKIHKLNNLIFTPEYHFSYNNTKTILKCYRCNSCCFNKILNEDHSLGTNYYKFQ